MRNLDRTWWTSLTFFVASVTITTGAVLYRAQIEENRYGDLFKMIILNTAVRQVPLTPQPIIPKTRLDI